jgi:DNA-binding GntR family transcriptional regulator
MSLIERNEEIETIGDDGYWRIRMDIEEPALQHQTLLDCALKRDATQARAVLTMHVNNCVEHALASAALR